MSFPLNRKCWNWKWWKERTFGWVLFGIMPFFQKALRSGWWNFALYVYIRRSGIWLERVKLVLGEFFFFSIWIGLDNFLSLCSQFNGCQINLWITLNKILSRVFLCFLTVQDNKDAMVGGNKNLKLKWFHKFGTLDDLIKKLQTNLDFYI